jgi:hypothetical protein
LPLERLVKIVRFLLGKSATIIVAQGSSMENRLTSSPRDEQKEKLLFLFVVVGYIITFALASNAGDRYSVLRLFLGISLGRCISAWFFEAEILMYFSACRRNTSGFLL